MPPEVRPQHHNGIAARHLIFILAKSAPQPRRHAQRIEVVPGNHHSASHLRRSPRLGTEADRLHTGVGNHSVVTRRFVAYVPIFAVGEIIERSVARRAHQRNYVPRMRHRIRAEDQRIHHAECRRRHPDSQRQRDYHERRQSRRAPQPTDRKSHILQKILHQRQSSLGSIVLFDRLHATKLQHRLPSRLDGR